MKGLKITNKTGIATDTKVSINDTEIQNCISRVDIVFEPGDIVRAKLTMIVSEIDTVCKVKTINKLELNKHGLSRIN